MKTTPEITPGQWEIWGAPGEKSLSVGPVAGGVAVCEIVTTDGEGRFTEETAERGAANARAIAALPDLLAALEEMTAIAALYSGNSNLGSIRENQMKRARAALEKATIEKVPKIITCPGCNGAGHWEAACCNGAGGCDCRGQVIDMGPCNVCGGAGTIPEDAPEEQRRANLNAIAGQCFIGRGPTSGYWANRGARGGESL